MKATDLHAGDLVEVSLRGRTFRATVLSAEAGIVVVDPPKGITYHRIKPRDVVRVVRSAHWDPTAVVYRG